MHLRAQQNIYRHATLLESAKYFCKIEIPSNSFLFDISVLTNSNLSSPNSTCNSLIAVFAVFSSISATVTP